MKKLVPDPPPVLCIREGLSPDEALYLARQHLNRAIDNAHEAAEDAPLKQETLIGDSVLQMKIALALLKVCVNHRAVVICVKADTVGLACHEDNRNKRVFRSGLIAAVRRSDKLALTEQPATY